MPSWKLFQICEPVKYTTRSPAVKYRGFSVETVKGPAAGSDGVMRHSSYLME
jgi:hypothetical protein